MLLVTVFRRSPAIWLSPVLLFLILLFARESLRPASTYYPLALTVTGASQVFLIAPFCAACAAWEAGRLRRAGWFGYPRVRSLASLLLLVLAPVATVGIATTSFAVLYQLRAAPSWVAPDATVLGVAFGVVLAHSLVGFAVGTHIRPVIAAPSVLLLGYAWMVMPPAFEPLWLRHLSGAWTGCCSVSHSLDPRALLAVAVVALGLALTALLLIRVPMTATRLALSIVPIVLAFQVGVSLVQTLGPDPVVPRSDEMVCSDSRPRICLWQRAPRSPRAGGIDRPAGGDSLARGRSHHPGSIQRTPGKRAGAERGGCQCSGEHPAG